MELSLPEKQCRNLSTKVPQGSYDLSVAARYVDK